MPTSDTSTGIGIQRNRERNIPDVDVQMLPTAIMLNGVSYTAKEWMVQIWGADNKIVYGTENQIQTNFSKGESYSRQLSTPSNPSPGFGQKVYGVSTTKSVDTYELPTLTYLANAMILNPYLTPVNTYLTKKTTYTVTSSDLDTYGKKVIVKGSAPDAEPGSTTTSDPAITGEAGSVSFGASPDNTSNGTYQQSTKDITGAPVGPGRSVLGINRVTTEPPAGEVPVTGFFTSMSSTFALQKNQPFGLNVSMFTPADSWLKKLNQQEASLFGTGETPGLVDSIYSIPRSLRKNTVTFIEFGGGEGDQLMIVLYQQRGKVELYKLGTQQISSTTQQPNSSSAVGGNNGGQQQQNTNTTTVRTRVKIGEREIKASADSDTSNYLKLNLGVYPIGNQLVISDGEDGLRSGVKAARHSSVAIFDFSTVLNISSGPIKITTYLGAATYVYSHLLHIPTGLFASPIVDITATRANMSNAILSLDFEGRVGGGQVKDETDFKLPMGTDTFYQFLSDGNINIKTASSGFGYEIVLTSNENDGGDEFKRIYSPRIYGLQIRARPQEVTVNMNPVQIDKNDIIRVEVTATTLGLSAAVTLNNRKLSGSKIPDAGGKYNKAGFSGVKPIQIKYCIKGNALEKRFVGYVTGRSYSLGSKGTKSDVTLKCEDVSIKAKNTYAFNLPIFDGWCQLGAFYYLAKEAGYGDSEIVFDKDGQTLLSSVLEGDIENMTGGCFEGHKGVPFKSQTIHAPLPVPNNKMQPFYMFSEGTSLWNCMLEIRKFSGFYLFANKDGKLVYAPPENVFTTGVGGPGHDITEFVEQGGQAIGNNTLRFTEIQNQLNVEHRPINSRNKVVVFGYDTVGIDATTAIGKPIIKVAEDSAWPFDTDNPNYIPWRALTVLRNPMWNDSARIDFIANETFKRVNRPYVFVSWSSFGQVGIRPYDMVFIDETLSAETGVTGNNIVITSITDRLDANTKSFFSTYEGEIVNVPTLGGPSSDNPYHPHYQGYTVSG